MPIGSILGGMIGSSGASAAGSAAAAAGQQARDQAIQEAGANKSVSSPYLISGWAGTNALMQALGVGRLNPMNTDGGTNSTAYGQTSMDPTYGASDKAAFAQNFQASPGYQFRLDQGNKALDRSAASKGMLLSGSQTQALSDYNQKSASAEWGNYINGLTAMSGQGASAASNVNNANTSAMNQGNALQFQGNMAQAASYQASANAMASGIANGINNLASMSGLYGPMQGPAGNSFSNFMDMFGGGAGAAGGYAASPTAAAGSLAPSAGLAGGVSTGSYSALMGGAGGAGAASGGAGAMGSLAPALVAL